MPCDVTMHEPRSWIVRGEGNHNPATAWQKRHVATRWVNEVEVLRIGVFVEDASACAEDEEVVSARHVNITRKFWDSTKLTRANASDVELERQCLQFPE